MVAQHAIRFHSGQHTVGDLGDILRKVVPPGIVGWCLDIFTHDAKIVVTLFDTRDADVPSASPGHLDRILRLMTEHAPSVMRVEVKTVRAGDCVETRDGFVLGYVKRLDAFVDHASRRMPADAVSVHVEIEAFQGSRKQTVLHHYEVRQHGELKQGDMVCTTDGGMLGEIAHVEPSIAQQITDGLFATPSPRPVGLVPYVDRAEDVHRTCNEQLGRACKAIESLSSELTATRNDLAAAKNEHQETRTRMGDWLGDKDRDIKEVRALLGEQLVKNQKLEREIARLRKGK